MIVDMNKLFILPLLLPALSGSHQPEKKSGPAEAKWSGTVSFQVTTHNRDGGSSIWKMDATIHNDTGTATHSSRFQRPNASGSCFNQAKTELEVGIDEERGEYSIFVAVPGCYGRQVDYGVEKDYATTDETGISIDHQRLGSNHNVLSGIIRDSTGDGEGSSSVTIYTWNLSRGDITDELIVTPVAYDSWEPEPGTDETTPGKQMQLNLKLQDRSGGNPSLKVVRFELQLKQTSTEPGIALNFPVSGAQSLPDLRFDDNGGDEISSDGQFIKIESTDGRTGEAIINAYDGGAFTILNAEAVLDGGRRVKGKLLNPSGVTDIQIPKRQPGTKIATHWLTGNGNPGEMDDKETGGSGPGDGLTAYEEYRGVISEGGFKRLDPRKKEVGIWMNEAGFRAFREGVEWFKTASGIIPVYFKENEIDVDRNLNKNHKSAHDYDQKVLKIEDGATSKNAAGENRPVTLDFMVPVQSELIVINLSYLNSFYPQQEAAARADGVTMPYTLKELIASTVAHEVGHGVNINHHGPPSVTPQNRTAYDDSRPPYHIFRFKNNAVQEIPVSQWRLDAGLNKRVYDINGITGIPGNEESGDLSCIMAYTSLYTWCFHQGADGSLHYCQVPLLPVGKSLCTTKDGSGINKFPCYFGRASVGNCKGQIKLR